MIWKTVPVGAVIRASQYGLSLPAGAAEGTPIVGMKDIQSGRVRVDPDVRVSITDEDAKDYLLNDGDILLNRTNSPDLVGKTGIYRGRQKAVFASYLVRLELDRDKVDPDYLVQILASEGGQRNIRQLATRAVSQANINPTTFKNHFHIPLPSLEEQVSIRDVLLEWDVAIAKAERLIEVHREQTSQLRERLLRDGTNTMREKLRAVTRESTERNRGRFSRSLIMAVTKESGMRPMREETIAANIERYKLVPPNAFAYNPMRLNIGSIAMSEFEHDVLVSPDYVVFKCDEARLLPQYLNHLRFTNHWISHFGAAGSGSVRVRIYYGDLAAFAFDLPPIGEQRRIVEILDAAVLEITMLCRYADLLRKQKRGLMQKLLTGKWRVPAQTAEAA
ncbi:restriction endonuclease subunit S [Cupriavidus sp. TMH.W2]|uniref:restriction endonuclease subunit S n=1 Tax=Cupriavidus sp. TMH.W2 TaxID=3434465 RepID=UPI003D783363